MKEVQELANKILGEMHESGAVEAILRKQLESSFKSAVESAFRSFGAIGKKLEADLTENIKIDLTTVDFDSYNMQITKMLKGVVTEHYKETASRVLMADIEKMLEPAPATITVEDLVAPYIEYAKEEEQRDQEYACLEITRRDSGWSDLKLWNGAKETESFLSSGRKIKNDPILDLYICNEGTIRIIREPSGNGFGTMLYGYDAKTYQMYARKTVITDIQDVDIEDIDVALFTKY